MGLWWKAPSLYRVLFYRQQHHTFLQVTLSLLQSIHFCSQGFISYFKYFFWPSGRTNPTGSLLYPHKSVCLRSVFSISIPAQLRFSDLVTDWIKFDLRGVVWSVFQHLFEQYFNSLLNCRMQFPIFSCFVLWFAELLNSFFVFLLNW